MDDVAPDASVFSAARDPQTGQRQLEELAFELASTESSSHAARKAQKLAGRGVRRIFAVDVTRRRAVEWSAETGSWSILERDSQIEDSALAAPLPVRALVSAAKADDAVARALLTKRNPVLLEALTRREVEGKIEGKIEALLAVLVPRGLVPSEAERRTLLSERDPLRVDRWLQASVRCSRVAELLDS